MKKTSQVLLCLAAALAVMVPMHAQEALPDGQQFSQEQLDGVQRVIASKLPEHMGVGELKVRSVTFENDTVKVDVSENFGDVPFTQAGVEQMRGEIRQALGAEYDDSPVLVTIVGNDIN